MSDDLLNPYAAPESKMVDPSPRLSAWRWIPAVIFSLVGGICLMIGGLATAVQLVAMAVRRGPADSVATIVGCLFFLGLGLTWLPAGKSYRKGRYRQGAKEFFMGIVVALVLFGLISVRNLVR